MKTAKKIASHRDSYMDLIQLLPLRPIRSRDQYQAAANLLDRLVLRDDLDRGEEDYLEVLENLIDAYDNAKGAIAIEDSTPVDILRGLLAQAGMTARELAKLLDVTDALVSMILAGKRSITVPQARKLAERFKVEFSCFL